MASNNVVKNDRFSDYADQDPLAELSRIMGLDRAKEPVAVDDDDFGIDLERELFGELDVANESAAPAAATQPVAFDDFDADIEAAFADEADFAVEDVPAETGFAPTEVVDTAAYAAPAVADETYIDFELDDLLDEEMALADEAPGVEEFEVARFEAEDVTPVEPVVVHQPVQSLEDELGALLNEGPVAAQAEFVAPISDQEFGSVEPLHDFQAVEAASVAIDAFEPEVVADEPTLDAAETIAFDDADFELDAGYDAPQDEVVAPDAYLASQPVVETFAEDRYEAEDPVQAQIEPVVEIEPVAADPTVLAEVSASDEIEAAIAELQSVSSWQGDASADVPPAKFDDWAATAQEDVIAGEAAVDWVEAADPAPLRPSFAPEPVVAAGPVAPAEPEPAEEELDPFAALAALAAAPPILKALGRANPVAVNRGSERDVYQRAEQRAPEPVVVRSEPVARIEPAVARERYVAPPAPVSQTPAPVVSPSPAFVAPAVAAAPEIARSAEPVYTKTYQPAAPAYQAEPVPVAASYDVATPGSEGAQTDHSAAYQAAEDQFDASELDDLLADEFATDFETVDVPDEAIAVTDELDLPDLAAPEDAPASRFDDFDADFADAFNQLSVAQPAPRPAPVNQPTAKSPAPSDDYDMLDADFAAFQSEIETNVGSLDDADDLQDVLAGDPEPAPRSRLPLYGAIFAGLALLVGAGAYGLGGFGGTGTGEPALVRADATPVKVKPETPGGVVVPNQDGKVYESVAGADPKAPTQEKLVSTVEEPITPQLRPASDALPGVDSGQIKSEERVLPADTAETASSEQAVGLAPRKVRTMVVRPDGTLAPREETPAAAAAEPVAVEPVIVPQARPQEVAQVAAAQPTPAAQAPAAPVEQPVAAAPAEEKPAVEEVAQVLAPKPVKTTTIKPKPAPEPAPQPAARAEPQPEPTIELAGGAAAAAAPAAGLWTVQIASQPTREGAQASYEALAKRYGGVIGGKGVNIVQANIEGKGTMWRVRIPSASRSDANILCAKLKTAGGSCFVSR